MINRPKLVDYLNESDRSLRFISDYYRDLESYCDYLEKCLKENQEYIDRLTSDRDEPEDVIENPDTQNTELSDPCQIIREYNDVYAKLKYLCDKMQNCVKEELDRETEDAI